MTMSDASRFRDRARYCRQLAANEGDEDGRRILIELADDLEAEADRMGMEPE